MSYSTRVSESHSLSYLRCAPPPQLPPTPVGAWRLLPAGAVCSCALHPSLTVVVKLQAHASGGDLRLRDGENLQEGAMAPIPPAIGPGQGQDGTSPSGKGAFGVASRWASPTPARGGEPVFPGGWADGRRDGSSTRTSPATPLCVSYALSADVLPVPWPVTYQPPYPG